MAENMANSALGEVEGLTNDPKAQSDFTDEVDALIPKAEQLAKGRRVEEALEQLQSLEKKCRQQSDGASSSRLCCCCFNILVTANEWQRANEIILTLTKKRGQLKRSQVELVRLAMTKIPQAPNYEAKIALINTLAGVTDGKIFIEVERARVVKILADIRESEGKIEEASKLLQDVQVETFGAMDKREKAEYILEQMRLVLKCKEYVRCSIISKKLSSRALEDATIQDLKVKYYDFLIRMMVEETREPDGDAQQTGKGASAAAIASHVDQSRLLDIAKAYFAIYNTPQIQDDAEKAKNTLQSYVVFLLLAPFTTERKDLLNKANTTLKKKLEEAKAVEWLLHRFLHIEILDWPLEIEKDVAALPTFDCSDKTDKDNRWQLLRKRVVQHNIEVIGAYYSKMHISRLAHFLSLDEGQAEAEIAELVSGRTLSAKMDRIDRSIAFGSECNTTERLDTWSGTVRGILDLVEESGHLIFKERMVKQARDRQKAQHQQAMGGTQKDPLSMS